MAQSKKRVLEEEEYVEGLEKIIERDFFPDLKNLKLHKMWLEALESNNPTRIQQVKQYLLKQKNTQEMTRSSSNPSSKAKQRTPMPLPATSSWDQPTPPREARDNYSPNEDEESDQLHEEEEDPTAHMTLNNFIANHTSEDNAAFEELQEKAIKDHQRKYHWAFEDSEGRGDAKLHLLKDGTWMSQERRQLMDKACDTKLAIEDNRPVAPETWNYRARNPLLFPPDLETNRDICKLPAEAPVKSDVLLLENGKPSGTKGQSTSLSVRTRTGAAVKKPTETVYANSRFSHTFLSAQDAIEEKPEESIVDNKPKDLVAMTPLLVPGEDASPMITWGSIDATPMIIRGDTPLPSSSKGPSFVIKETSAREKLAHQMDARNKQRMKARSTPTPLFSKKYTPTPLKSTLRTPSIFGGDMQLRASYSTPMRQRPPLSSKRINKP